MNAYPANKLPKPTKDLSGDNATSVIRTKMDSGRYRQKRRFSKDFRTLKVAWLFTDAEFTLFQAFVFYKTSSGADWFTIDLPGAGGGYKNFIARFTGNGYKYDHVGVLNWKVTATLELQDEQLITEAAYNAAIV